MRSGTFLEERTILLVDQRLAMITKDPHIPRVTVSVKGITSHKSIYCATTGLLTELVPMSTLLWSLILHFGCTCEGMRSSRPATNDMSSLE